MLLPCSNYLCTFDLPCLASWHLSSRYISCELARALGTVPSALLRQPIGDIMPQPWGTLHEAWIRSHSSQAGPGQFMAPPGSCRTGMAMVLGASHRIQGYYRMAITSMDESDDGGTYIMEC